MAQLPETSIYLFEIQRTQRSYTLMTPKKISKKKGYNNQPYFSPDDLSLYYVSAMDTTNTEVMKYDLKKRKSRRLTKTKECEYSPKFSPDMSTITCVRVEQDKETQHLASYTLKGKKPLVILPELKSIGYYEWISQSEFISFELPEPFYLVKHNIMKKSTDTLATHIGRCFVHLRSKGKIVYLDKSDSLHWKIRTVAQENLKSTKPKNKVENPVLTESLAGEEDFCFLQDGSILMGHEGKIYCKKNPFKNPNAEWQEWADLSKFGINKFYRMALSADNTQMAIVVYEGEKP